MSSPKSWLVLSELATAVFLVWPQENAVASDPTAFKRYCSACHSVEVGRNKIGPSLAGIVGRQSASIEGFNYSAPMRSLGVVWTKENLDRYLTAPADMVAGTNMMFPGLRKEDERRSLIEYLANPDG